MKNAAWGLAWVSLCAAVALACTPVGTTGSAGSGFSTSSSSGFGGSSFFPGSGGTSGSTSSSGGSISSSSSMGSSGANADPPPDLPRTVRVPVEGVTEDLHGVTVASDGTAWAVGASGAILRRAVNSGWLKQAGVSPADLMGVAAGPTTTLAVGLQGTLLLERNGAWTVLASGTTQPLNGVVWDGAKAAYVVVGGRLGGAGVLLRVEESGAVADESPAALGALFAATTWNSWAVAVGESGAVWMRLQPQSPWERRAPATTATLLSVTATPVHGLVAGGERGTLLALPALDRQEAQWGLGSANAVLAVASRGGSTLVAMEDGGLRHVAGDGRTWNADSPVVTPIFASAADAYGNVWLVGAGGVVLQAR